MCRVSSSYAWRLARRHEAELALGALDRRLALWRGLQCRLDTEPNEVALRRRLEEREVLAVAPRERPAESPLGAQRRVVNRRDHRLVIGLALAKAREAAQVRARGEYDVDAGHAGDLVGDRDAGRRLDHRDDHDVVVRDLPIVGAVQRAVLAVAEAAFAARRIHRVLDGAADLLDAVDERNDD